MRSHYKAALLLFFAIILLSACSASLKEEQNMVKDTVSKAFESEPKETNNKNEDIKFYLPFGFEVEKESPNNIILKNGSKKYILFYNQHEGSDSKVVYEASIKQNEYDVKETYSEKGKFGFLLIKNTDKNMNEMTIGVGGVKITTNTKTKNLATEASAMIDIVQSVKMK